jgi:guanine deaminase
MQARGSTRAYRASIAHCLDDPGRVGDETAAELIDDGTLVVEDGRIAAVGPSERFEGRLGDTPVSDLRGKLILPGLIDCHVHFAQLDIIASFCEELLDWLRAYAYPAEAKFADEDYAARTASFFLDELLKNGTTTAAVFPTVHAHATDALFEAASTRNMRLICGKVLMDDGCPGDVADGPRHGLPESRALIGRWHGKGRLGYAITPRFALTSSAAQLAAIEALAREFPDVWVHTHVAENRSEIRAVARRFPWAASYLDVYDKFGLVRERGVFAHCLHLSEADRLRMGRAGAGAAFCPTSNLFLGSGLYDLDAMDSAGVRTGLGTDVGAGTSLSMLATAGEAYKVLKLQRQGLSPVRALYLSTLGAARALHLDDVIGNFTPGKEADFIVLDPAGSSLTERRIAASKSPAETLFVFQVLGDDRHVAATYVLGEAVS